MDGAHTSSAEVFNGANSKKNNYISCSALQHAVLSFKYALAGFFPLYPYCELERPLRVFCLWWVWFSEWRFRLDV